jgi:hypothetical protein
MTLWAVGVKVGERIASQTLLAFSVWTERPVDPGAPPTGSENDPCDPVQPENPVSKEYVSVEAGFLSALNVKPSN